jgi:hypothetical protein
MREVGKYKDPTGVAVLDWKVNCVPVVTVTL